MFPHIYVVILVLINNSNVIHFLVDCIPDSGKIGYFFFEITIFTVFHISPFPTFSIYSSSSSSIRSSKAFLCTISPWPLCSKNIIIIFGLVCPTSDCRGSWSHHMSGLASLLCCGLFPLVIHLAAQPACLRSASTQILSLFQMLPYLLSPMSILDVSNTPGVHHE